MRFWFILLIILFISFATEPVVIPFLDIALTKHCPGDLVFVNASFSNKTAASDVELRLILNSPYLGFRALKHTKENGTTFFEIDRPGEYRIYIRKNDTYNSNPYVWFNYSEMCPLPPPKSFNVSIMPYCEANLLEVNVVENGLPLEDVLLSTYYYSSLTNSKGSAVFPIDDSWVLISSYKQGYLPDEFWTQINCPKNIQDIK